MFFSGSIIRHFSCWIFSTNFFEQFIYVNTVSKDVELLSSFFAEKKNPFVFITFFLSVFAKKKKKLFSHFLIIFSDIFNNDIMQFPASHFIMVTTK